MKRALVSASLLAVGLGAVTLVFQGGRQVYLPSGWSLNPAGTRVTTGDLLAGGETSPDGRWIAWVSVGQGVHKAYLFRADTGAMSSTIDLGRAWHGITWSDDSKTLYISGGTQEVIHRVAVSGEGSMAASDRIALPAMARNRAWLSGLTRVGDSLVIASSAADSLIKVDANGTVLATLPLEEGAAPFQLRSAANGKIYASLQGLGQVIEVDPTTMTISRTMNTGRHPNDLLIQADRLFVSCGNDDVVDVFDIYDGTLEERLVVRPWPDAPPGSTPHALALSPDGKRLYVALSDNNAVAVYDVERRGRTQIEGFIPSGAYPTALATTRTGDVLIGSAKGFGTGPNDRTDKIDPVAPMGYPYIVTLLNGFVSKVPNPTKADMMSHTQSVLRLSKYRPGVGQAPLGAPKAGQSAVPSRLGDPSPIQHVLYIIKENRTYDQLFGDLKRNGKPVGNGDPRLTLFGEDTAPNHRRLALDYVLLDNLYASGEVSVDGHHWTNGAYVPDFMQRTWPQQYSGKGTPRLTVSLAQTPRGRIWDQVRRAGKSYRTYYYHTGDRSNTEWAAARARNERDYEAVDIFIREFRTMVSENRVPSFMVMALSEDHTRGTTPGAFTPKACVASNDWGLGKIVEEISSSSVWSKFAIFVIEDDAQNGPDHVDAHRTVGLVISPFTRGRGVDSTHYTTTSFTRTMGLILGTQPMSQFDAAATPMYRSFGAKADLTPYKAVKPTTDLLAKNPPARLPAVLSSIDFSEPDQLTLAQEIALNRAIWASIKGSEPYPGATRRYGFRAGVEDEDLE